MANHRTPARNSTGNPGMSRGMHRSGEARYRQILDHVSDGVYIIDTRGYFVYLNENSLSRSGLSADRYTSCHYLEMVAPEHRQRARENFDRVMQGNENPPYELCIRGLDGREHVREVKSTPLFENGHVVGLLGVSRDITARKQAEEIIVHAKAILERMVEERTEELSRQRARLEAEIGQRRIVEQKLRESETLYRTIFDNTGTAMMIVDESSTIRLVNAEFEKLSGYSRPEAEDRLRWTDLRLAVAAASTR